MSENIPESVPTSQDPRSKRPTKRRALTPNGQQAAELNALFANPQREIVFPDSTTAAAGRPRQLAPPPEIVQNVQGSSAGAGSGEFHVYKASRRREYERLRLMDEETQREKDDARFEREKAERRTRDDEKTRKNREKREKAKKRKAKGKDDADDGAGDAKVGLEASKIGKAANSASGKTDGGVAVDEKKKEEDSTENGTEDAADINNPDEIGITIHDED